MDEDTYFNLQAYRSGDTEAMGRLLARHYQRVVRIVRSRLGFPLRKRTDVEDVVQDVMIDALNGIEKFEYRGEGSFSHWIAVVAMRRIQKEYQGNVALKRDLRREKAVESMAQQVGSGSLQFELPADEASVASLAAREELVQRIEGAIQSLPEDQQEVIRLRNYAGCTFGEIADIRALSGEMAASRLYSKALTALGKLL